MIYLKILGFVILYFLLGIPSLTFFKLKHIPNNNDDELVFYFGWPIVFLVVFIVVSFKFIAKYFNPIDLTDKIIERINNRKLKVKNDLYD